MFKKLEGWTMLTWGIKDVKKYLNQTPRDKKYHVWKEKYIGWGKGHYITVEKLAKLLHSTAASASILFSQVAYRALTDNSPLMQAHALDNSPQSHKQM